MKHSTDRILVTHAGSLPRPHDLHDMMREILSGRDYDKAAYDAQAQKLVGMFAENFGQYLPFIDADVKAAAIG